MTNFTTARNDRTSYYEVHVSGCKHLIAKHMEVCPGIDEAATGAEVAERGAKENEGCAYTLGPCAKAGAPKDITHWFIDC